MSLCSLNSLPTSYQHLIEGWEKRGHCFPLLLITLCLWDSICTSFETKVLWMYVFLSTFISHIRKPQHDVYESTKYWTINELHRKRSINELSSNNQMKKCLCLIYRKIFWTSLLRIRGFYSLQALSWITLYTLHLVHNI